MGAGEASQALELAPVGGGLPAGGTGALDVEAGGRRCRALALLGGMPAAAPGARRGERRATV